MIFCNSVKAEKKEQERDRGELPSLQHHLEIPIGGGAWTLADMILLDDHTGEIFRFVSIDGSGEMPIEMAFS
jgi:hypothetical protein